MGSRSQSSGEAQPASISRLSTAGMCSWGATLVIAAHFAMTWTAQRQVSVASAAFGAEATKYSSFFFSQRWLLFAPDPPSQDVSLAFRCGENRDEGATADSLSTDGWLELGQEGERGSAGRFGVNYLLRMQTAANHSLLGQKDPVLEFLLDPKRTTTEVGRERAVQRLWVNLGRQSSQQRLAYRTALAYCEKARLDTSGVQVRVQITPIRPYSRRNDDDYTPKTRTFTFPWRDAQAIERPFRLEEDEFEAFVRELLGPPSSDANEERPSDATPRQSLNPAERSSP